MIDKVPSRDTLLLARTVDTQSDTLRETGSLTCFEGGKRLSSQKKGFSIGLNLIKSSPPVAYWGAVELKSSPSLTHTLTRGWITAGGTRVRETKSAIGVAGSSLY